MAKKTPIEKLDAAVAKILAEYEGEVLENLRDVTKKFAQKGAQAVRGEANAKGWGKTTGYPDGWTSTFESGRYSQQGIIYNKDAPGLVHLLEKGHALRGGGRSSTSAFPHAAPVEEKISEEYYKAVKDGL